MTLHKRILGTLLLVVLLTVTLSVAASAWIAQGRLTKFASLANFTNEGNSIDVEYLAYVLSQEYTLNGEWSWLQESLYTNEYVTRPSIVKFFDLEPRRCVILDISGKVIFDSFIDLGLDEALPKAGGQRAEILNVNTGRTVALLYLDDENDDLFDKAIESLDGTLLAMLVSGLLTALIILVLAAWLAERITTPITTMTRAMQTMMEDGNATQLPITSNDELDQMSSAFNQLATDLAAQKTLRKRLIDDVSHELNTPLSVIQLEAQALSDGMQSPLEAAKHIRSEVEMLRTLVHDLNWLADGNAGAFQLTLEPYSLSELLAEELDRWQQQAQNQQICFVLKPLPTLPPMHLDKVRMKQALGNVLRNALQHTNPGGQIILSATLTATPDAKLATAVIMIKDDGTGIDVAELPHVFERLYRTDQSRSRITGGYGLGLAIAHAIIEAHNGTISVASDGLGHGTTVWLELPI